MEYSRPAQRGVVDVPDPGRPQGPGDVTGRCRSGHAGRPGRPARSRPSRATSRACRAAPSRSRSEASSSGTQTARSVEPSTSTTCGSTPADSGEHLGREDQVDAVVVLDEPVAAGPVKCVECTSSTLAGLDVQAGLLVDLPAHRVPGVLAVVDAAARERPAALRSGCGRTSG